MLLVLSIIVFLLLMDTPVVHLLIRQIGQYGYLGSFITGIFIVSTFTIAPASVVLFHLAQDYNPYLIALSAGAGSVIGDLLIFRFFKDRIFSEFSPLVDRLKKQHVFELFKGPHFGWLAPVIGALIIASPLPDEIGVGLMGLGKVKEWQFIILTFVLNTFGIFMLVLWAQA